MSLRKIGSTMKIASNSITLNPDEALSETKPNEQKIIEPKNAEFLYFRARAISAGDQGPIKGEPNPNGNGDYFPRRELEASYESFVGKNLFLNHESDHPIKSVGKILDAYSVEDDETGEYYIETLAKIDRKLHPEIARKIETGELNTVSMGCACETSKCSICALEIHTDEDTKCEHLSSGLLKSFTAETDIPEFGIEKGRPTLAFSINSGLHFNELSIVNVPADADAVIKTIIASNLKNKISKKASLDKTEVAHFNTLFANLDDDSKKELQETICACPIPKEDNSMSKKEDIEKAKSSEDVTDILQKMNAWDYHRLLTSIEKKVKKIDEKKHDEKVVDSKVKTADSVLDRAIEKVKNSSLGKLFQNAVKRELTKTKNPTANIKKSKRNISAKFTKAKNFVDSYWTLYENDKEILKAPVKNLWDEDKLSTLLFQNWIQSDKYKEKLIRTYKTRGLKRLASLLGVAYEQTKIKTDEKVETPKKSEFEKPGEKSQADKEADKSKEAVEKHDDTEVGTHLKEHEEVVKEAEKDDDKKDDKKSDKKDDDKKEDEKDNKKDDKKDKEDEKKDDSKKEDKKEEKPDKKDESKKKASENTKEAVSPPGWEKTVEEMKDEKDIDNPFALAWWMKNKGYEPKKKSYKEYYAEYKKDLSKTADESVIEDVKVEDDLPQEEVPSEEAPKEEPKIDEPTTEEVKKEEDTSLFDHLDEPLKISDAYEAEKDKNTNEIIIKDVDGKEVKRLDDGFGHDAAQVLKLLEDILNIDHEEKLPGDDKAQTFEPASENPAIEEPASDDKVEPELTTASKDDKIKKEAAKVDEEKKRLEAEQIKVNAEKFALALKKKATKCKAIVEEMIKKDMIKIDENDINAAIRRGSGLLDARKFALEKASNRKLKKLLAMDTKALDLFAEGVHDKEIKKHASNELTSPLHVTYNPPTEDNDVNDIFNSMGNGGGI